MENKIKPTIVIIIIWIGPFKNYFSKFLYSCANNFSIDFLIFTDNKNYNYFSKSSNLKFHYFTFLNLVKIFQSKFDFKLVIENPYKFCDFKPAYGFVFSDFIKSYDYWGFCDTDIIFGNIRKFLDFDNLIKYDRIFDSGQFSLFKNDIKGRTLFMIVSQPPIYNYRSVFSSNQNFAFDEWGSGNGINTKLIKNGCEIFLGNLLFSDIKISTWNLRTTREKFGNNETKFNERKKRNIIYLYLDGSLFQVYLLGNKVRYNEQVYVHFQKRKIIDRTSSYNGNFLIVPPGKIIDFVEITSKLLKKLTKSQIYIDYFLIRLRNLIRKIYF